MPEDFLSRGQKSKNVLEVVNNIFFTGAKKKKKKVSGRGCQKIKIKRPKPESTLRRGLNGSYVFCFHLMLIYEMIMKVIM